MKNQPSALNGCMQVAGASDATAEKVTPGWFPSCEAGANPCRWGWCLFGLADVGPQEEAFMMATGATKADWRAHPKRLGLLEAVEGSGRRGRKRPPGEQGVEM